MQIWRSLGEVPPDLGRTVVTVGNFDGVHRGHQHVVARAREVAGPEATWSWPSRSTRTRWRSCDPSTLPDADERGDACRAAR